MQKGEIWRLTPGGLTLERAWQFLTFVTLLVLDVTDLQADFFGRAHRVEHTADDLRGTGAARFVGGFLLHELGMRQDDAELVVQLVKELPKFPRLFHSAPLEQICN
jgi:hypothetical protein